MRSRVASRVPAASAGTVATTIVPVAGRVVVRDVAVFAPDGLAVGVALATLFVPGIDVARSIVNRVPKCGVTVEEAERRAREEAALREVARELAGRKISAPFRSTGKDFVADRPRVSGRRHRAERPAPHSAG